MATLKQDATSSTKGTIFQLCLAVAKCFEMEPGDKIFIEKKGDVTIEGKQQVEAKNYSDSLTDSHLNLWKTLSNWLQDEFDPSEYFSLILYTTQEISKNSRLLSWNDEKFSERLKILEAIKEESEQRHKSTPPAEIPQSLRLQRHVLSEANRGKLLIILDRFIIEDASPSLPCLVAKIKNQRLRGILLGKKDEVLHALIGFVAQPEVGNQTWEISNEDFDIKFNQLIEQYCAGTTIFPQRQIDESKKVSEEQLKKHHENLFVKKIEEIEHTCEIENAIRDYLASVKTINDELKHYNVPMSRINLYASSITDFFIRRHRIACSSCNRDIEDSKVFYDEMMTVNPKNFDRFNSVPQEFHNGIIHIQMDDEELNIRWRLTSHA